jgi:hypothetical protein
VIRYDKPGCGLSDRDGIDLSFDGQVAAALAVADAVGRRPLGISDTPAWIVAYANAIAEQRGWTGFCGLQPEYSLAQRDAERDLLPMARAFEQLDDSLGCLDIELTSGHLERLDKASRTDLGFRTTSSPRPPSWTRYTAPPTHGSQPALAGEDSRWHAQPDHSLFEVGDSAEFDAVPRLGRPRG